MNLDTNSLVDASEPLQGLPQWARASTELRDYYLREWGVPVTSETGVFERLSLEVFQAGLSWATILRKRDAFREVFAGFEPDAVAALTDTDVSRLMSDSRIVRNRRKIEATVANARATIALREHSSLPTLVLQHAPGTRLAASKEAEIPTRTECSAALANTLRTHGFRMVGPTNMYALMCAIGPVNAHLVSSHRYPVVERMQLRALEAAT